jgi:fucose permease
MVVSFLAATAGGLSFALHPSYEVAVISLFVMGSGMAALQVAINPLLRVAGGAEHFAFFSTFAQLVFGAASFLSPLVYSYLVNGLSAHGAAPNGIVGLLGRLTPPSLPWLSIYWLFALGTAVMAVFIALLRLPKVERTADESAGTLAMYGTLMRNPLVWTYFLCIIAYVGCEQGTADWMSQFLYRYHGYDPHVTGASAVSNYWALLMLTLGLFGPARVALVAFPAIGFFASVMWPTVVSLALNSVPSHHGPFAGILCSGIMGGALVPLLIGKLGDLFGLRAGMLVLYITFGVIFSIGFWARPLINNALVTPRTREPA